MEAGRWSKFALAAVLIAPTLAYAGLNDVGPVNAGTGFPNYYRDTNLTPAGLCLDQRPSPNASAGGAPLCFPVVTEPAGYPGNMGGEIFYFNSSASLTGAPGVKVLWEGAIEATYATGVPIRGDEVTFARIRVVMNTTKAGNYKVTHPFGVENFPNVPISKRGVFFTTDVGVAPGVFTGALAGNVGPFLQWASDPANPSAPYGVDPASGRPYSLTLPNPDGTIQEFLGDPNIAHTLAGSPFGTNFVRIDGPPGSNLDGLGNDFLVTSLFMVLGQKWMKPIPIPLEICRATYGIDVKSGVTQLEVFGEAGPGSKLLFTAQNLPSIELTIDATGYAVGHSEVLLPPGTVMPAQVTVTNVMDNPHSMMMAHLTDVVTVGPATFFPDLTGVTAGTLSIIGETSVKTATPPKLSVVELPYATRTVDPGTPWVVRFDYVVPAGVVPQWDLTVVSQAGGKRVEPVVFALAGVLTPLAPFVPTAASYLFPVNAVPTATGTPVTFALGDPAYATATLTLLNPPANGTAVVNLDGSVTYTPTPLYSGVDTFTYLLSIPDPANPAKVLYSNAGSVDVDVAFVNQPPTATADVATTAAGTPVVIAVASNDRDIDGTIVLASVATATPPLLGTATPNGDGTITFTPAAGFVGTLTFKYTITDNLGAVSAPGTVTVSVFSQTETVTISTAQHIITKARWRVTGTSSAFGPGIANVLTVYIGRQPNLGKIVGSSVITPTGGWSIDVIDSTLALDATRSVTAISTGGGVGTLVVTERQ